VSVHDISGGRREELRARLEAQEIKATQAAQRAPALRTVAESIEGNGIDQLEALATAAKVLTRLKAAGYHIVSSPSVMTFSGSGSDTETLTIQGTFDAEVLEYRHRMSTLELESLPQAQLDEITEWGGKQYALQIGHLLELYS